MLKDNVNAKSDSAAQVKDVWRPAGRLKTRQTVEIGYAQVTKILLFMYTTSILVGQSRPSWFVSAAWLYTLADVSYVAPSSIIKVSCSKNECVHFLKLPFIKSFWLFFWRKKNRNNCYTRFFTRTHLKWSFFLG